MPIVNTMILYISTFIKGVDLMLSVFHTYTQMDTWKLWAVLDISIILIVVMLVWVFDYVPNHQILHIKYVQFFVYH